MNQTPLGKRLGGKSPSSLDARLSDRFAPTPVDNRYLGGDS